MPNQQIFEFRGVDNLYVAEVLQDDAAAYLCGTPVYLAPVAEIGKTTDSSSEALRGVVSEMPSSDRQRDSAT